MLVPNFVLENSQGVCGAPCCTPVHASRSGAHPGAGMIHMVSEESTTILRPASRSGSLCIFVVQGYYDNLMFHRIIPKFMVQGGDPTGTGQGGESVFGEPFKDEIHSRLRFAVRGLLAMANGGKDDNGSQFFLTLAPCEWLNGKHTIFGKVTGKTIYNLDAMGEYETDEQDKPLYPPRILSTEVIACPFDDIIPRDLRAAAIVEEKTKVRGVKKKSLLSFADDEEAPGLEEDNMDTDAVPKKKMVAAHDVLEDAMLIRENDESRRTIEEMRKDEEAARLAAGAGSGSDDDSESDSDEDGKDKKSSADRRREEFMQVKAKKLKKLEEQTAHEDTAERVLSPPLHPPHLISTPFHLSCAFRGAP